MSQATFSVRMEESLKDQFDKLCREFGMNTSTAINVFARAVVREKRIPFEISADRFYSANNIRYLNNVISEIETGSSKVAEHSLIED